MNSSAIVVALAAAMLTVGCHSEPDTPLIQTTVAPRPTPTAAPSSRVTIRPDERALIDQLEALIPKSMVPQVEAAYSNPSTIRAYQSPKHKDEQALADRIDAIRIARNDSIDRARQASGPPAPVAYPATLVLLPELPDTNASAVVWRRTRFVPSDVIALGARHASLGAFGAAVQTLSNLRRSQGDTAVFDMHVVVRGEHVPKKWQGEFAQIAQAELLELEQSAPSIVPPFGPVRSRVIYFPVLGPGKAH